MIELILGSLFVISASLVVYHHIGYPLLLKIVVKKKRVRVSSESTRHYRNSQADRYRPSMTILVPAYNEQAWIAQKIRNLACIDYPRDRYKVVIVCDGCTDHTVDIAEATIQEAFCSETHFEIISFAENQGKVAIINQMMQQIESDITALSDVSALISVDALLLAEQHFARQEIGVVNSRYQILQSDNEGEVKYWHYQEMMQRGEASLGANIGAHGALYFFRTHLFTPLKPDVINDDFVIPMAIVRAGYRAIYEPNVVAIELESTNVTNDFKRRVRISAGNMQQIIMLSDLLSPRYKAVAFAFGSGKTLRLLTPYFLITCFITSLLLSTHPLFLAILLLQIGFYTIASLGLLLPSVFTNRYLKCVSYFVAGHSANLCGGIRYICRRHA
ncbi:glycosyltransferase family 2 protein [Vibrio panuliri]|uniref:Glycosyl transferase n=1 Tax=Vibrio panuliri TaxID=1381081 RepID=A0ABX3FBZ1_9VIBR|nr:glycosyltransferase family 2 protein [Vibrio panuliri]KAB1454321.1 glycosyltransferase family 2 protein [Vibrio panuliri]OLQ89290.1 glycosyl transferase [Vibrio panuliri]